MRCMSPALVLAGVLAVFPLAVFARPGPSPAPRCLKEFWVNQTCSGTCSTLYTICPGKVMCIYVEGAGAKSASAFSPTQVTCRDYAHGTGTCSGNTSMCEAGTYVGPSSTIVTIQVQTCPDTDCR